jgi:HKD family nuclease
VQGQKVSSLTQHPDVLTTGLHQPLLPQLLHAINHASEIEITVSFIRRSGLNLILMPSMKRLNEEQASRY